MTSSFEVAKLPLGYHYEWFNAGAFCGVVRESSADGILPITPVEQGVVNVIQTLAHEHGIGRVVGVDLGGMMGVGSCMVHASLSPDVCAQTTLLVTNKEQSFTIEKSLEEMRLLADLRQKYPLLAGAGILGDPFVYPSEEETVLLEQRHASIVYESGVDTLDLPKLRRQYAPGGFYIIHEFLGGLQRHADGYNAFRTVIDALDPNFGMLVTGFSPVLYEGAVEDAEQKGIRVHVLPKLHGQRGNRDIFVYAYPQAPYAVLRDALGY